MIYLALGNIKRVQWAWILDPHDIWVGGYWKHGYEMGKNLWTIYICLIPMLPVRLSWHTKNTNG